jgi:autotransporter translocation and assembly factor TamB
LALLAGLIGAPVLLIAVLQVPGVLRWAAEAGLAAARPLPGARVLVGGARGGILAGIELHDLRIVSGLEMTHARIETLQVAWRPLELIAKPMRVRAIRIAGVTSITTPGFDSLRTWLGRRPSRPGSGFVLDQLAVSRGTIEVAPDDTAATRAPHSPLAGARVTSLELRLDRLSSRGGALSVAAAVLRASILVPRRSEPLARVDASAALDDGLLRALDVRVDGGRSHARLSGALRLPQPGHPTLDGTDVTLRLSPLAGADLTRLVPTLRRAADVTLDAHVRGAGDSLEFAAAARASDGARLDARGGVERARPGPAALIVHATFGGVDLASWSELDRGALVLAGSADADLSGTDVAHLNGPVDLAVDASGSRSTSHPIRVRGMARFSNGDASVRADVALDRFALHVAGTARPLGDRRACDLALAADIPPVSPSWRRHDANTPPLLSGRVIGTLQARSDSAAVASGRAAITFSLIGDGRLDAALAGRDVDWKLRLAIGGGALSAAGSWRLDELPVYAIRSGEARAVPLGALLGDSLATTLDAAFTLEGRGISAATARAAGVVAPLTVTRGAHVAHLDSLDLALHDGRLDARLRGSADATAIEGTAWLRPAFPPVGAAGMALRFRDLNGARFFSDTLFASRLDGTLEGEMRAPDLAEWLTPARLSAARAAAAEGSSRLVLQPSEWRHDSISTLVIRTTLSRGEVRTDGTLEATFGRAQWSAQAQPFGPSPEARLTSLSVEELDLSRLLAAHIPSTRLAGSMSAASSGASLDSVDARCGIVLDGSKIGTSRFGRLRLSGNLVRGLLEARVEADDGPDSILARFAGRLRRDARGGLAGAGRIQAGVRLGGAVLDTVNGEFALERGVLKVSHFEAAGNLVTLSAHGQLSLGAADVPVENAFEVRGRVRDLRPLGARFGIEPLEAGATTFECTASGPPQALALAGHVTATRLKAGRSRVDSLELNLSARAHGDSIASGLGHVYAHGLVPEGLQERDLTSDLSWNGSELGVEATARLVGGGSEEVALRIGHGPHSTRLSLDRFSMTGRRVQLALEQPAVIELGHEITVEHLGLLQDGRRCLTADGAVRDDPSAVLTVTLDSLDVAGPASWLGWPDLKGRLSAVATLRGPRHDPVVDGWLRGTIAPEHGRWARMDGRLAWSGDSLRGELRFDQTERHGVDLNLSIPLGLNLDPRDGERVVTGREGGIDARLESRGLDFAWFEPLISPRLLRQLGGRMDGTVHVTGSPSRPELAGELHITKVRAQIPPLATTFQSKDLGLKFQERTVVLGPSQVTAGSGRLELTGRASFEGGAHRAFETHLKFDQFRFMNTALARVEVSGELTALGGSLHPALTGTVTIANSTLYAESGQSDRKFEPVELTEADWRELDARFSDADVSAAAPMHAMTDSVRCDVTVKLGRNVWVRRRSDPIVALELTGQVRATREPAERPELSGRIDVVTGRSYLSFLSRRFDLTRANIELPGPIQDASAELEAQYLPGSNGSASASGPEVTALVTLGQAGARVDLHSTPYMEHAALINYLATGQTQGEMASGTAYGLAVGSVLGSVGGSAGRSLGLDVVQVTQDAYGGQTLSAGSHVKPQLYLGFRQPVVEGQQTSTRGETSTYTTEFEVEVEAGRRLLLNLQGGGSQYRFLLRPRLGK